MPCCGRVMCWGDRLLSGGWSWGGGCCPRTGSWAEALGTGAVSQELLPDGTPALQAVNSVLSSPHPGQVPMRLRSCGTAPALPSPDGGWGLRQGLEGGAWLHVCGKWTVSQSHVCGEQVFRLCVVSMSPRGPASVLAAASPPRHPPCPGLVTSQKGASVSSGNSSHLGCHRGLATPVHLCPLPTKALCSQSRHRPLLLPILQEPGDMWPGQCQAALGQGSDRITAVGRSFHPGVFRAGVFVRSFYKLQT